jgi:hypothetical protein
MSDNSMKKYVSPQNRDQSNDGDAYTAVLIDGSTLEVISPLNT